MTVMRSLALRAGRREGITDRAAIDPIHERVASRIRELARERRIPLSKLPERVSLARSHFWNVLGGRTCPTLKWLARIASALEVDIGELLVPQESVTTRPK